MEKEIKEVKITITQEVDENGKPFNRSSLDVKNIDSFELIGILRYFEKKVFLDVITESKSTTKFKDDKND